MTFNEESNFILNLLKVGQKFNQAWQFFDKFWILFYIRAKKDKDKILKFLTFDLFSYISAKID